MNKNLVSIIIPTHNRKKKLKNLIDSLLDSSYVPIEIIVVDNGSTDGTVDLISEYRGKIILLRNNQNLLVSAARNKGIRHASGEFLFFIDDDNVVPKDLINLLVGKLKNNKNIGEVGPVIYAKSKKNILWAGTHRDMFSTRTHFSRSIKDQEYWETDDIPNAFMVRNNLILKHKIFFDEKLFPMHYEESDFSYRIRNAGYKVVVSRDAKIFHDVNVNSDASNFLGNATQNDKRLYYTARNRLLFHRLYSHKFSFIIIMLFWNFVLGFYYVYEIIKSNQSILIKIKQSMIYLHGIFDSYVYALAI